MANKYWDGSDPSWTNDAAWGGTAPAASDSWHIVNVEGDLTSNLDNNTLDTTIGHIGPGFVGSIGDADTPLILGQDTTVYIDAPEATLIHVSATDTGNTLIINRTAESDPSVYVSGSWANIFVVQGRVQLTADAVVSGAVHLLTGNAFVDIDEDADVAEVRNHKGYLDSGAVPDTLRSRGGTSYIHNATGGTLAACDQAGGLVTFHVRDGVVSDLQCDGGVFTTEGDNTPKTITAGNVGPGGVVQVDNGNNTDGTLTNDGGRIRAGVALTINLNLVEVGEPEPI